MTAPAAALRPLLRLTLTPGLGPVLIARLLEHFGSAEQALAASPRQLEAVRGIGPPSAAAFVQGFRDSDRLADEEMDLAERLGVRFISRADADYPALLAPLRDAPPLLSVRGRLDPGADRYPLAIVGSRRCSAYGIEQAERFAGVLAGAGLTIVSGGARGIDTAAHRGAARAGRRTVAVLGCGLAEFYPPENAPLFDRIVGEGTGAVVSELPLRTPPEAGNFPARNRIISGMSLGVLVIEAGVKSGALITAREAAESHGREVFALPGRVDSPPSAGALDLIKQGGALLVTDPGDIIQLLESPARHQWGGTHATRYANARRDPLDPESHSVGLLPASLAGLAAPDDSMSATQRSILQALSSEPLTLDGLATATALSIACLRAELTALEIQRRILRQGSRFARRG